MKRGSILLLVLAVCPGMTAGCGGFSPPSPVGDSVRQAVKDTSGSATFADATGQFTVYSPAGPLDLTNPFFQSLGTNGRTCASCHVPASAFTITPSEVQARFDATQGEDPIFRPLDGTVSPLADLSTLEARRAACAMLLSKGLIRVGIGVPESAEFTLTAVDDPYGFAGASQLSLFRRPPPATNLRFLSTVMWDGRESFPGEDLTFDLTDQALGATLGHAQAQVAPSADVLAQIVAFELGTYSAQSYDNDAQDLTTPRQAQGGPQPLATAPFHLGINDVLGGDPAPNPPPFDPAVFHAYDGWSGGSGSTTSVDGARNAVARGQALFNSRTFHITGVAGLNDVTGQPDVTGTCSTCHDTPSAGNHSLAAPLDIGIADGARRTPDLPLYTLTNKTTGQSVQTTDPGRALITGRWADIGKFKGPTLRALAARPPYFHNGSAATLADVVAFYDQRFGIGLSAGEQSDLAAFLRSL